MRRQLATAVEAVSEDVLRDAQFSITSGSVSGKSHKPSAPGTAPNNNSGHLADGIVITGTRGALTRQIVSTAEYGAIHEMGGSTGTATLPERPYMRPAAKKNQTSGVAKMRAAVDHVISGGKFRQD
ncbi:hypothetical protein HHL08_14245 [Sphingobium sp. AR-3-1]|uniref:HK97 gp10 family phage protein n=1 Tax=Sphingobium psychrophilum TaxID=2728834 RepID=A0A7X9WWQ5_9SPHN|nr:hypothetical protein [Sphingobium psychrophilum]NML11292.1 hypothetical protein [Sphingobium psychrophilum]